MIIIRLCLRIIIFIEFFNISIGANIKYFHFQFQLFNYSKFMKNIEDILQIFYRNFVILSKHDYLKYKTKISFIREKYNII